MKRQLLVFAGQSNMMGAAVLPPTHPVSVQDSYEYLHKGKRLGGKADWRPAGYPCGEFSYIDLKAAYPAGEAVSHLADFRANTHFCPAMYNSEDPAEKSTVNFGIYSEADCPKAATLAPLFAEEWESLGHRCAYAHIAKGGVCIGHFFDEEMRAEFVRRTGEEIYINNMTAPGSGHYFAEKCHDFLTDAAERFAGEDLSIKAFVWLQGESDANHAEHYETALDILWEKCKKLGFTHFLMIRVDYFGNDKILQVMQAQERFCEKTPDAYMVTRAASFMPYARREEGEWFISPPGAEYDRCRDSFYGYDNQHINEKGFALIARRLATGLDRLLKRQEILAEDENIRGLF